MIIWGKQYVRKSQGYVADFCPMCHDVRAFKLVRVGLAGHIYYISLTEGELVSYERSCESCGMVFGTEAERYARALKELCPLRELMAQTFPNIATHYAQRFAVEKALRDPFGKVSPAERTALIKEPFQILAQRAEERYSAGLVNGASAAAFIAAICIGGVASALLEARLGLSSEEQPMLWAGVLVVAAIVAWIFSLWWRHRWMRKEIVPRLAGALRLLKPTDAEVAAALADMKALGLRIGSRLKPEAVMAALKAAPAG